jgi:hypothetical protein
MRTTIKTLILGLGLATVFTASVDAKSPMPSCKGATVYAVPAQKIYFSKGETKYGHVKGGTYMCQAAANGKGYKHATS